MSDSLPYESRAETVAEFASRVNPGKAAFFSEAGLELVMGEREGVRFRDAYDGREYFNCHCNGGVYNLGHRNPRIIGALRDAMEALDAGNHHLISPWRARLAERLGGTTGGRLTGCIYGVAGGEAIDLSIKLARGHTGRTGIISASGGYHGHTGLALAAGDPAYRDPFGPNLPGFSQVPFNDLEAIEREVGEDTAAVLLESIPATLGFPMPEPGYLAGVAAICRRAGALLILDEVQTGMGRTGTYWYYQQEEVEPDMIVVGKGLGGGIYPIAATLVTPELLEFFREHPFVHVSTFGGAELGCVAALEALAITSEDGFLERVAALGEWFESELGELPFELRRRGLTMAFAFEAPDGGFAAMRDLVGEGLFAVVANNDPSVLQFKPPLITSDSEAEEMVAIVRRVFG
ncbi:MAG TPA: aminotransferase class III-fold pyridoxal phosphate-dependent enzyme [Solirubrobacterales bacterium]|nr:aminotransferase class III-fold pyridoxal phosphate-dependent enzyme [Solirubrobacterales bacterium]